MTYVIIGAVVYVICGVLAYGYNFAYFQTKYRIIACRHYMQSDRRFALETSLFGPVGLVVAAVLGNTKYGLMFRSPWTEEERNR